MSPDSVHLPLGFSLGRRVRQSGFTEPFGLILLEAAACGVPIVATDDGGPKDRLARPERWRRWRDNGVEAVSRSFSWDAHVNHYLRAATAAAHQAASLRPSR